VRSENEDSLFSAAGHGVWLVADGMGGHENGAFASNAIVEAVADATGAETMDELRATVTEAVFAANRRILDKSAELGAQMGSTVVILLVRGDEFAVLWAGDSRAYVHRGGRFSALTRDHTHVEDMLQRGLLTDDEAARHPMKHVLTRGVGVEADLKLDCVTGGLRPDDLLLLCSDGLHAFVEDQEIAAILAAKGPAACDDLIRACLERGAPDNVTVALVAAEAEPAAGGALGEGS
jgi:serine/threonine protein phosphatase PrpC